MVKAASFIGLKERLFKFYKLKSMETQVYIQRTIK